MKQSAIYRWGGLAAVVLLLEAACRFGLISRFVLVPPSDMVVTLWQILISGRLNSDIWLTFATIVVASGASIVSGILIGALLHAWPRARQALDPYLASFYAVPIFVFYPTFIMLFGLNRIPVALIGFLKAMVVVIVATIDGLDRVPRIQLKTAAVLHMSRRDTLFQVILPSGFPYFLTGAKFAVAYAFLGVLGAEFILANHGIGYQISYAFNDFDNRTMYALMLLVAIIVAVLNGGLSFWERRVLRRWGMA